LVFKVCFHKCNVYRLYTPALLVRKFPKLAARADVRVLALDATQSHVVKLTDFSKPKKKKQKVNDPLLDHLRGLDGLGGGGASVQVDSSLTHWLESAVVSTLEPIK
jgi:hypothetical protein